MKKIVFKLIQMLWNHLSSNQQKLFIEDKLAEALDCWEAVDCYPVEDLDEIVYDNISNMDDADIWRHMSKQARDDMYERLVYPDY